MTKPSDLENPFDAFKAATKAGPTLTGTLRFRTDPDLLQQVLGSVFEQPAPDLDESLERLRQSVESAKPRGARRADAREQPDQGESRRGTGSDAGSGAASGTDLPGQT